MKKKKIELASMCHQPEGREFAMQTCFENKKRRHDAVESEKNNVCVKLEAILCNCCTPL